MGRIFGGILALLALLAAVCPAASPAAGAPAGFTESTVAGSLAAPTAIAFLPDGRLLVTEKGGALKLVREGTVSLLATLSVCTDKSMGLLGIAVDPAFALNGRVYVYRTVAGAGGCATEQGRFNRVGHLTLSGGQVAGPVDLPLAIRTDNGQHNGGTLRIGLDGKLYVSTGDTGLGDFLPGGGATPPGASTNPFAHDLGELPGKVLRINLDGSVPQDNPFVAVLGARPEVFAYGFRNPFRFGVDPVTGRLWLGDVGQNTWEELNVIRAGGNYGWPKCEGTDPPGCAPAGHVPPVLQYQQDIPGSLGASITGGGFAGCGFGAYADQYFFGDYAASRLYGVVPNAARDGIAGPPAGFITGADGPVDILFGPDRSLYYVAINVGEVRRIAPPQTSCETPGSSGSQGGSGSSGSTSPPVVSADKTPPRATLRLRARQRVGSIRVRVRLNEPATVTLSAAVSAPTVARTYRFKRVRRSLPAGKEFPISLKLRSGSLRSLRRVALVRRLTVQVKLTAVDAAGNLRRTHKKIQLDPPR